MKKLLLRYGLRLKNENLQQELGKEAYQVYQQIQHISNQRGIQARLEYDLIVK